MTASHLPYRWRMLGTTQETAMGYIIAAEHLANKEASSVSYEAGTAAEAWEKVLELQADGYTVRATTSEGTAVALDDLKVRALSTEGP
jgi:hypothetical protein